MTASKAMWPLGLWAVGLSLPAVASGRERKSVCSPASLESCDGETRRDLERYMSMSDEELGTLIAETQHNTAVKIKAMSKWRWKFDEEYKDVMFDLNEQREQYDALYEERKVFEKKKPRMKQVEITMQENRNAAARKVLEKVEARAKDFERQKTELDNEKASHKEHLRHMKGAAEYKKLSASLHPSTENSLPSENATRRGESVTPSKQDL